MSLFAVREHLKQSGPTTALALATRLRLTPSAVETMLEYWIRRGMVETIDGGCHTGGLCKTCGACSLSRVRWYRWCGSISEVTASEPQ